MEWFAGVRYERLVFQQPRPVVAHLVRIDLQLAIEVPYARMLAGVDAVGRELLLLAVDGRWERKDRR